MRTVLGALILLALAGEAGAQIQTGYLRPLGSHAPDWSHWCRTSVTFEPPDAIATGTPLLADRSRHGNRFNVFANCPSCTLDGTLFYQGATSLLLDAVNLRRVTCDHPNCYTPDFIDTVTDYTVLLALRLATAPSGSQDVFWTSTLTSSAGLRFELTSGRNVRWSQHDAIAAGSVAVVSTGALALDAWHRVAARYDAEAGTGRLWIDGALDAGTLTVGIPADLGAASLGATLGDSTGTNVDFHVDDLAFCRDDWTEASIIRANVCGLDGALCDCDWLGDPGDYTLLPMHTSGGGNQAGTLPPCNQAAPTFVDPPTPYAVDFTPSVTAGGGGGAWWWEHSEDGTVGVQSGDFLTLDRTGRGNGLDCQNCTLDRTFRAQGVSSLSPGALGSAICASTNGNVCAHPGDFTTGVGRYTAGCFLRGDWSADRAAFYTNADVPTNGGFNLTVLDAGDVIRWQHRDPGGVRTCTGTTALATNTFQSIVAVANGTTLTVFLDGVQECQVSAGSLADHTGLLTAIGSLRLDDCFFAKNVDWSADTIRRVAACDLNGRGCACDPTSPTSYRARLRHSTQGGPVTGTMLTCNAAPVVVNATTTSTSSSTSTSVAPTSSTSTSTSSSTTTTLPGNLFYVDGGCPTSGTGGARDCGASGPFRTIGEAVMVMDSGDIVDVRGPHNDGGGHGHGAFDGVYHEEVYLAPNPPAGVAGRPLPCGTGSQRCEIRGCRSPRCTANEHSTIRGARLRTDWTETAPASGIWWRTMEATPHFGAGDGNQWRSLGGGAVDDREPFALYQAGAILPYQGNAILTPAEGYWSYDATLLPSPPNTWTTTHRAYVNPVGTANPNTAVLVPHFTYGIYAITPTANVTFQYLTVEMPRITTYDAVNSAASSPGTPGMWLLNGIYQWFKRFAIHPNNAPGIRVEDNIVQHGCRGFSFFVSSGDGCFGLRLFRIHGGSLLRNIVRHLGCAGQIQASGGGSWQCSWCDPPWNGPTYTYNSTTGVCIQPKQSHDVLIEDNLCEDASHIAIWNDVSRRTLYRNNTVRRAKTCWAMSDFTPEQGCPSTATTLHCYGSEVTVDGGLCEDVGVDDQNECALIVNGNDASARHTDALGYLARLHNITVNRFGWCAATVAGGATAPSDVTIAHVTAAHANTTPDVDQLSRCWAVRACAATGSGCDFRNNICSSSTDEAIVISDVALAAGNVSFDYDLLHNIPDACEVRVGATTNASGQFSNAGGGTADQPQGGTCMTLALFQATGQDANGFTGTPAFTSATDLHIEVTSQAINEGLCLAHVDHDRDFQARPQGGVCDIGSDERP